MVKHSLKIIILFPWYSTVRRVRKLFRREYVQATETQKNLQDIEKSERFPLCCPAVASSAERWVWISIRVMRVSVALTKDEMLAQCEREPHLHKLMGKQSRHTRLCSISNNCLQSLDARACYIFRQNTHSASSIGKLRSTEKCFYWAALMGIAKRKITSKCA